MDQERARTAQRTYTGEGSFESPFLKAQDIPMYQFAEEVWKEHGQEIIQGRGKFLSVGRFVYLVEGIPDEARGPYQLLLEFRGFNPNYAPPVWAPRDLSEYRKTKSAVLIAMSLYRRFMALHLNQPLEQ